MLFDLSDQSDVSNLTPCQAYQSMAITREETKINPMRAFLNIYRVRSKSINK
jgi:hypothetical protein